MMLNNVMSVTLGLCTQQTIHNFTKNLNRIGCKRNASILCFSTSCFYNMINVTTNIREIWRCNAAFLVTPEIFRHTNPNMIYKN